MGATGSRSTGPVQLVHAGGYVEQYHRRVTVEEVMRRNPRHYVAKPEVFKYPSSSLLAPEVVLVPGDRFLLVPDRTVIKLYRRHGLVVPVLRFDPRLDALEIEKDATAGCKPGCASGRHNLPSSPSSLGDAGGAIQPKVRRKNRPGASRGRESPRHPRGSRTPTRKGGIHRSVRTPTNKSPRTPTHPNMGSRTQTTKTPTRKNPSARMYLQGQCQTSASKSRFVHPPKWGKSSSESAGDKKRLLDTALGGSKASQEVLDVKPMDKVVDKSVCPNPVQKDSKQSAVHALDRQPMLGKCDALMAGSLLSEGNPKIVEAATPTKSPGIALLDLKHTSEHGDSYANRSQDIRLGSTKRDKGCKQFDALVQRITNVAALNAQLCFGGKKSAQSLLPIPTTVKEMIEMFEEPHSGSSNCRLDSVKHSTLQSDAASRGRDIELNSSPESLVLDCIPVPRAIAPTSLQEKQLRQDLLTRVPTDACQPRRASQSLQDLIARADLHDNSDVLQLDSVSAGSRAVSCTVTNEEGMQEEDSPGDGDCNEAARVGVSATSPNSMESFLEMALTAALKGRATKDHNQDKGRARRMKLMADHMTKNVSPSNVVCPPRVSGHWEEPTSANRSTSAETSFEGKMKGSKSMHPEEDKVWKIPKHSIKRTPGRRLPGGNRYRYRIRWHPRLSPVNEGPAEYCQVAHSVAP